VHRWLVSAGVDRRPPDGGPAARDDAVALYQAGWSAPAIAGRVGCSPSTIYRRLDAAGVARRPVTPALSRLDLLQALDRGLSAPHEIAATHGVSVSCVCRALAREQLMTNSQAARQRHRLRYPEYYCSPTTPPANNVSVSGNAQR
jgi:hypothetical protein